jgi:hypothetical protein
MDDLFDILTPQKPPKVTDLDFFSPGGYAHVTIRQDAKGLYAQAERGAHKGPEVLRAANLRGMIMALRNLRWPPDDIYSEVPIPLAEMPAIEAGGVPPCLQKHPALSILDFEKRVCRAYRHPEPDDHEMVRDAFNRTRESMGTEKEPEYHHIDRFIDQMNIRKMVQEFSASEICMMEHSSFFLKSNEFELALRSEIAPLIVERIRLSAWHNHASILGWDEMVQVYNSLRQFSVGLENFTAAFDHTRSCNPKGSAAYHRHVIGDTRQPIYLDGELAYIISFKGKPVLVLSFNVVKPTRESAPAIYIRQIQLLEKTGNRWLYQLPCHYVEHFVIRMREAFSKNDIYLIRGDVLGEETAQNYEATLQRIKERLKQNSYFSADGRSDDEQETAQFQEKIRNMRREVIPRLQRNYARRSLVFHRFLRRKMGNYWKLHYRAPGEFVPAQAKKSDLLAIQQVQRILDKENPCHVQVGSNGLPTRWDGTPIVKGVNISSEKVVSSGLMPASSIFAAGCVANLNQAISAAL